MRNKIKICPKCGQLARYGFAHKQWYSECKHMKKAKTKAR